MTHNRNSRRSSQVPISLQLDLGYLAPIYSLTTPMGLFQGTIYKCELNVSVHSSKFVQYQIKNGSALPHWVDRYI
jgi:hypothetical protein